MMNVGFAWVMCRQLVVTAGPGLQKKYPNTLGTAEGNSQSSLDNAPFPSSSSSDGLLSVHGRVSSNSIAIDPLRTVTGSTPPAHDNGKPIVLVPPINPNSAFANKVTTGEGKVSLGWPKSAAAAVTKSLFMMNKPLPSKESQLLHREASVENGYRNLYEQCASELHAYEWFKTITPEELATPEHYTEEFKLLVHDISTMEATGFMNIIGNDRHNRKVILITVSRLQVVE